MPRVFRIMREDDDQLPMVGPTGLGIRPGIDVDLNGVSEVLVNGKGMSVAPNWRDINVARIPKRLRTLIAGARGSNNTHCFRMGEGPFQRGNINQQLILEPDSPAHGNIAPATVVSLNTFEGDLAATRPNWVKDES